MIRRCGTLKRNKIFTCGNRARFTFRSRERATRHPVCGTHLRAWLRVYPKGIVTGAGQ